MPPSSSGSTGNGRWQQQSWALAPASRLTPCCVMLLWTPTPVWASGWSHTRCSQTCDPGTCPNRMRSAPARFLRPARLRRSGDHSSLYSESWPRASGLSVFATVFWHRSHLAGSFSWHRSHLAGSVSWHRSHLAGSILDWYHVSHPAGFCRSARLPLRLGAFNVVLRSGRDHGMQWRWSLQMIDPRCISPCNPSLLFVCWQAIGGVVVTTNSSPPGEHAEDINWRRFWQSEINCASVC